MRQRFVTRVKRAQPSELIDVVKWDADANQEGVTLYATVGASARPIPGRDPGHRVEFFVGGSSMHAVRFWDSGRELESSVQGSR